MENKAAFCHAETPSHNFETPPLQPKLACHFAEMLMTVEYGYYHF
jgi:hypothetical protein